VSPTFLSSLRAELYAERWVFYGFLGYFGLAGLIALHQKHRFNPLEFAIGYGPAIALLLILWLALVSLLQVLRHHKDSPLAALPAVFRAKLTPQLALGVLLIPFLLIFIQCFLTVKILLPKYFEFAWDAPLAQLDRTLHGGVDPWFWLQPFLGHPIITRSLELVYSALWLLAILFFPVLVTFSITSRALRHRYFYTYLLSWALLGNLMAGLFLSGGPVYYDIFVGDSARFAPIIEYLRALDSHALSALGFRDILLEIYRTGKMSQFGGISALPSMHISMATLFACVAYSLNRWFFAGAVLFLVTMLLASIHLGWHYAIDGYVAIVLTLLLWWIIGRCTARLA